MRRKGFVFALVSFLVIMSVLLTGCNGGTAAPNVVIKEIPDTPATSFEFEEVSGGAMITSFIGNETEISIPANLAGKKVIAIDKGAFSNCSALTYISVPDSVLKIGDLAFENCSSLTDIVLSGNAKTGDKIFDGCENVNVIIADGSTEISESMLLRCTAVVSVSIPSGVTSIGASAFSGCTLLKGISIPSGVTSIGTSAFSGCKGLTTVTMPDSITEIEENAFHYCEALTEIKLPSGLNVIGDNAFSGCTLLKGISIPNSVTSIGEYAFNDCSALSGDISIPDGVTEIILYTFGGCTNINSISIPNTVTKIGARAFSECARITNITIPDSVTEIASDAFYGCNNITITYRGKKYTSDNLSELYEDAKYSQGDLYVNDSGVLVSCKKNAVEITIPDSVTSIGKNAFSGCTSLENVTIPDSVTSIGWNAFEGCTSLTSIIIPSNVGKIDDSVFKNCTNLENVTIPDSVTSIYSSAFEGCVSLSDIVIPTNVTKIDYMAFMGCTRLKSITLPDGILSIGTSAFEDCTGLEKITLPDGVASIGACAFEGCTGLTSLTIPESVVVYNSTSFDDGFEGPKWTTNIGERAFADCTSLETVILPDNILKTDSIFEGCSRINLSKSNGNVFLNLDDVYYKTIQYLGYYDLTKDVSVKTAYNYFNNTYGADVEVEIVAYDELMDTLSSRIMSGQSPDIVDKMNGSIPYYVTQQLYEPLDDYIDLTASQWTGLSQYIDQYAINGQHYYYPTNYSVSPYLLIYNKSEFARLGINDPYDLYQSNNWTWDTFYTCMTDFTKKSNVKNVLGLYGMAGTSFINSTGTALVTNNNGQLTTNVNSNAVERAQLFLTNLRDSGLSSGEYSAYDVEPIVNGFAAFQSASSFMIGKYSKLRNVDFTFVPFPRDTLANGYYYSLDTFGYLVPRGASNIAASCEFINCLRLSRTDSNLYAHLKNDIITKNNYSADTFDKLSYFEDPNNFDNLVIDFAYGLDGNTITNAVTPIVSDVVFPQDTNKLSWADINNKYSPILQSGIDNINAF